MALARRTLTESEINDVFELLRLTGRAQRTTIHGFGRSIGSDDRRETRSTIWISNGSEPIKAGRIRHAQLEGADR